MKKAGDASPQDDLQRRLTRLQDREAIEQALIRHARSLDDHDLESFLDQFDATFSYSYDGHVVTDRGKLGKAAQKNWLSMPKTTHLLGNIIISFVRGSGDDKDQAEVQATVTSDCLALTVQKSGEMGLVTAAYRDRLVKRAGVWRFSERVIETRGPYPLGGTPS